MVWSGRPIDSGEKDDFYSGKFLEMFAMLIMRSFVADRITYEGLCLKFVIFLSVRDMKRILERS